MPRSWSVCAATRSPARRARLGAAGEEAFLAVGADLPGTSESGSGRNAREFGARLSQPRREGGLVEGAGGEADGGRNGLLFWSVEPITVQFQKHTSHRERHALVAVAEWMVPGQRVRIGGRELKYVGPFVGVVVSRTRDGSVEQPFIPHSGRAPVFREEALVDRQDRRFREPPRPLRHFARSRSAFL